MKLFFVLVVLFSIHQQGYGTMCTNGTWMEGTTKSTTECGVTESCSLVSATITPVPGSSMNMEVGQCILTMACEFVKCSTVEAFLPEVIRNSFQNCRARCCRDDNCHDVEEDGRPPFVPYGGGGAPAAARCGPPIWNSRREDNWSGIPNRSGEPTPKFALTSKKLMKAGGYTSGKEYKFIIRSVKKRGTRPVRFNGFFIFLQSNSTTCGCKEEGASMCPVGSFITSRIRRAGAPVVEPGCDYPIVMDYPAGPVKKSFVKWRAPPCNDAEIIMRTVVRGVDGVLYSDNDDVATNEQFLTQVIRPVKHKKPKKNRRKPRRH